MSVMVLLSGGLDSAVVLRMAALSADVQGVYFFDYGQVCAEEEYEAAVKQCERNGLTEVFHEITLPFFDQCSHLLSSEDGLIHDTERIRISKDGQDIGLLNGEPLSLEVPYRNMVFLSYVFSQAALNHCKEIWGGFAFSERSPMMDQNPEVLSRFALVMEQAYPGGIVIHSPLDGLTYPEIIQMARDYGVKPEETWSCLNNLAHPCGVCGKCTVRLQAFKDAGYRDPAFYMTLAEVQECLREGETIEIIAEKEIWKWQGLIQ